MDSAVAAATYSPHQTDGAAQPGSHSKVVATGFFSHQQQPQPTEQNRGSFSYDYVVPLHIMGTTTPSIVALSNTHQMVSLKLTITNFSHVFHFVEGLVLCPPSHVSDCSNGSYLATNPSFLRWK